MEIREQFWLDYYATVARNGAAWLDYSNERVQSQTFALTLEAAGPIRGRSCLDVGCGRGTFAAVLAALGAASVTGLDLVPEMIANNRRTYPQMRWATGTLADLAASDELDTFDLVFFIEVLQYVPLESTLRLAWAHLRPGGRLIAVFPNAKCPIVSRTRDRFDANYAPPALEDVLVLLAGVRDCESVQCRGFAFGPDQHVVPYEATPWLTRCNWTTQPNRVQLVARKCATTAAAV
jgi:2-polyprenyl-3-methyl-5-hydroxy-6-metoxy-1,4-benzoquinol methylase